MHFLQIAQSTSSVGAQNILTISLQSTVGIQAVTGGQISGPITIIGLVGFKDATGQKQVTNQGYNSVENLFVGNSANWDKASGKLVFEIATGKQLAASRLYVFSVTLTNPDFAQASPEISLELAGTRSAAAKLFAMEKASGLKAPLQIDAPTFKELRIGQKYSGAGILNELTVTFTPNLLLGEGYRFNIEGLTGSRTPDTAALPVAGCADIFSSGRWSGSSGTIELYAAKTIPDSTKVVCSFNLLNPTVPQSAATVSITVNVGSGQVSKVIGPKIFRNAPKLNAPFIVPPATFIKANIGQSAPYPGDVNNRITVSLQSNFNIGSAGGIVSSITISGLMGSMTTDSRVLPLVGDVFTRDVASTAAWTKDSGTLVITIGNSQTMSANTLYTFSFVLSNPSQEQSSPEVSISLDRGQAISSMPMTSDTKGCIHSKGDTAPLFIYPMGFLTKKIGIRASWPQASNVVSITLQSSMPMSSLTTSQTSIVVSGLSFDTKFDPAIPITSSAPELFGTSVEWNAAAQDGQLVIKLLGGKTLTAGTQYQIDVVLKNGVVETTWRPQISVKGPATIAATNMEYGGNDWPVQVSFSSPLPTIDVGMTFALTTIQKISKGDTIIVTLPGFTGTGTSSGKHLWGVTSDPPAFMIESTEIDYMDAIAGGSNVALAKYRVGTSSRTHVASSDLYGETGSTIVLDSVDAQVFGKSNVYAGMQMSIAGSNSYHSIYEQTASAPELPAVAHFYPKYQYTEASAVPAGATYAIHSQLEFTSKEDICAGTKVSITVPKGSGIVTPDSGIKKGILVELSHVKTGLATASIGTPDSIASSADQYSGENGKMVEATQVLSTGQDYIGLPWAPTRISTTNFVFVDGFRGIQKYDAGKVWIFPGYGPIRQTTLHAIASGNAMQGTKLELSKNIPANSNDVWLTLSSVADFKPALAKGSFLQLKDEVLRFTGDKALSVVSVESPGQPGEGCQLDTQMCGAGNTNCATITFAGCSDNPSVSVVFSAGAISRFTVKYGGACTNQQIQQLKTPALKATLTLAAGVTCTTTPSCDTGCSVTTSEAENVIKVQRSQFSTSAASLTSCAATTCTDWVKPSTIYLANGGLNSLLYTSSTKELDQSNKQSVKIGYSETVDTVVAGDHVVSVTLPQMPGSNCRKVQGGVSPQPCNRGDVVCATISFSGCSVNPAASLTFENGLITAVPLSESADAGRYGQSICQPHETPVGMIVLENDVECDVDPSCGNGCTLALDSTKDTLVVKHRSMAEDVPHIGAQSVVRVHAAEDIDFKIVLVPPTLCTVEYAETTFLPGQCAPAPKANSVVSWMDPATGGILASMYATADGLSALCLDLGSGALPDFPPACKISCDNKTADGNLVASKPVNITLKYEGNSTGIQVVLMMPITLNTAYVSATRRVAPANFEYRLNGDCECPSSVDSVVNCTIAESGVYQASLVKQDKCKVDNGNESIILAAVLGAVSGILLLLLGCYACDRAYRRSKEEEPKAKEVEEGYEGPVFVGRPVPLTPTLQPYGMLQTLPSPRSPVPINLSIVPTYPYATIHGASPVMAHDAPMWNNSNSFQLGGLPATLTPLPLTRQPARSPVLNMSASMPQNRVSLSPRREREEMGYMTSPRQGSMSPEARASPRSARMPYGV